ncbi:MAG: hypothetical protein EAX96_03075 [Candidatus Lokiarchaeota archaeon]|nr:hypothetical protein [Candidatus Lokiarchaeota archaeon]
MAFLKKYILHHLFLGIILIIEGILLILKLKPIHLIWGVVYLVIGIILFIDDLLAETKDISMMKKLPNKIQEENTLKTIGLIIFILTLIWFILLFFIFN